MLRFLFVLLLVHSAAHAEDKGPHPMCRAFLSQVKAALGLKDESPVAHILDDVVYGSKTAAYFEDPYPVALREREAGGDFVLAYARAAHLDVVPKEFDSKVPKSGPLVVVANHPFGVADALAIYEFLARNRPGEVTGLATTAVLDFIPEFKDVMIKVDFADEKSNRSAALKMARALKDNKVVVLFPAGKISRRKNILDNHSVEREWQEGAATMALRFGAQILPIHLEGSNTRLTDFLFWLGNKLKMDELLSGAARPWENFRRARDGFDVRVGDAFKATDLKGQTPQEQTADLYSRYLEVKESP